MLKACSSSHRLMVVALAALSVVASAAPQVALARELQINIGSGGQIETGVGGDPVDCFGPLSTTFLAVNLTNGTGVDTNVTLSAALDPGLTFVPGSCTANIGVCNIVDPSNLAYSAVLPPGGTASIISQLRVGSDVPIGTTLCANVSAQFGTSPPITARACVETNSARQCGLGAPAVGSSTMAVLVALLFVTGFVLIRRRA